MGIHCMVDLETLGTSLHSVVLSLGAVKFDPNLPNEPLQKFYVRIDPESCQRLGLVIEAKTVMWWMSPDRADARAALLDDKVPQHDISDAMDGFAQWYGEESLPTWSNGATFDLMIMRTIFERLSRERPWGYHHERCYRTLKNLAPEVKLPAFMGAHHALEDAVAQTLHLQAIVKALGIVPT